MVIGRKDPSHGIMYITMKLLAIVRKILSGILLGSKLNFGSLCRKAGQKKKMS